MSIPKDSLTKPRNHEPHLRQTALHPQKRPVTALPSVEEQGKSIAAMKVFSQLSAFLAVFFATSVSADANETIPLARHILPSTFVPPANFENVNLVRSINLERVYPRETINVVVRNIGSEPQDTYYLPFEADVISRVGGLEVRDRQQTDLPPFVVAQVDYDAYSSTQFYRINLPAPLAPHAEQTLTISFHTTAALTPLPAKIAQTDKQYLQYVFSAYSPSSYQTLKQKTKVRFSSNDVPDYTKLSAPKSKPIASENSKDPVIEDGGKTFVYGPFSNVPAGSSEPVSVRYEFTHPLTHISLLERDVEVSHWGGNLAMEERYELLNRAAALDGYFSRVQWQQQNYYSPPSVALKGLFVPLAPGSINPYYVDDIGNVSTSKFTVSPSTLKGKGVGKSDQAASLELRPRYPVFGDWRYKFKIGWDRDLDGSLRKLKEGDKYVFRTSFLEGPKEKQGVEYGKVVSRIILPEGAINVQYETAVSLISAELSTHRTFMDTLGRTTLTMTAMNLNDESRNKDVIITYDYPFVANLRKPLTIMTAVFGIFTVAWLISMVDVRIGQRKA